MKKGVSLRFTKSADRITKLSLIAGYMLGTAYALGEMEDKDRQQETKDSLIYFSNVLLKIRDEIKKEQHD